MYDLETASKGSGQIECSCCKSIALALGLRAGQLCRLLKLWHDSCYPTPLATLRCLYSHCDDGVRSHYMIYLPAGAVMVTCTPLTKPVFGCTATCLSFGHTRVRHFFPLHTSVRTWPFHFPRLVPFNASCAKTQS